MLWANLDMITRRTLLEKGLPLHYYLEILLHQSACVRDLVKDTLQIVNTCQIAINSYGAADLPVDFVDEVAVCMPVAGELSPIPRKSNLNPLRNVETDGSFTPYTLQSEDSSQTGVFPGTPIGWYWFWNVNDFGEPTGRYFGLNGGCNYGYEIFRERRQIQFSEGFIGSDNMLLMYISNGQRVDNATQIDWRAFRCIQTYSDWMSSPNANMKDAPEARTFYAEKRLLRAEMNDLTITDIIQILHKSYTATIKN